MFTIILLVTGGCTPTGSTQSVAISATPNNIYVDTATSVATEFVALTETFVPATPSPTVILPVIQQIEQACVSPINEISDLAMRGVVVLEDYDADFVNHKAFFHDLERASVTTLAVPGEELGPVWGISPDRKYLLYEQDLAPNDSREVVADAFGQIIKTFKHKFPNEQLEALWFNWQNSEDIRAILYDFQSISPRVYNPFTETYTTLSVDYPGYVAEGLDWGVDAGPVSLGLTKGRTSCMIHR